MQKEYLTVLKEASAELEEKRSRFIATVRPVKNEEEAVSFINGLKSKYWNATHNVYAYYICDESTHQKFSDDGEPSGTAGQPVLEAIRKLELQDVSVVVTRYFGGTLLGASGLIRAYGKSALLGLEAAGIIKMQLCVNMSIMADYSFYGKIQSMAQAQGYTIRDAIFTQDVEVKLNVPVDEAQSFEKSIIEATNARALIICGEKEYVTVKP